MEVSVAVFALATLLVAVQAQVNYIPALLPIYNISNLPEWNNLALNRTQWDNPALNRSQWDNLALNRSQWNNSTFNKTDLIKLALDRTQWNNPALNKTQWNNPALNRSQWDNPALNRSQWDNPALNRTGWAKSPWNYTNHNGDLIVGSIGYLDRLLFNQIYYKSGRWWSSREKTIEYPKDAPNSYYRHETIASVRIYNKFYDGLNSKAEILSGGVGSRYVKIRLSSSWGKGFKYSVQIYGH
ncbi:uncharacterized protein BDFB_006152 [Asbolus verrucosus]|uniref:Uncharacterized protein n=1 Tax=Asbolus verrucosus TaxID=1661398 RepID=A0A482VUQ8_ASBVE|nr:uncharacterized protein BDFB_006152 [Asbolus verrucosus]